MRATADYVALIPPLNANKPNFVATVSATAAPFADLQTFLAQLPLAFDLDEAIGAQLDVDGKWIGRSRVIPIPVENPWFSWAENNRGWGQAYWKGPTVLGDLLDSLDDDTYRRLLRAKIIANYGDGTIGSAQDALSEFFTVPTLIFTMDRSGAIGRIPGTAVAAQPSTSMHWQIGVSGKIPTVVELEILAQNLIPIKPPGVFLDIKVTTVDDAPVFAWGMSNQYGAGWGQGAWGASPDYVVQNII